VTLPGAYGTAVLYRKKDDDSLVILKEINMHDLNASERQMALNEVRVLAMLDHPNIISYYDSFEEDGTVMIEMEYADGGYYDLMFSIHTIHFSFILGPCLNISQSRRNHWKRRKSSQCSLKLCQPSNTSMSTTFFIGSFLKNIVISYIVFTCILHRDLKTANIFLTKEGVVKVGDF
jgi:NIMA (never in mitosis gene a)-related kinase